MLSGFGELVFSIRLFNTSERVSKFQLGESATSDQKPDTVGGGPIGKTMLDSVALELVSVGRAEYLVPSDLGGDDLADNVFIGEANNEAILGSVIFVLGLSNETLAGVVVSFSFTTTLVLGLVAAVLLLVANYRRRNTINDTCL